MSKKISVSFEIYDEAHEMLKEIVEKYNLPDTSKAIRCLLDYAAQDGEAIIHAGGITFSDGTTQTPASVGGDDNAV